MHCAKALADSVSALLALIGKLTRPILAGSLALGMLAYPIQSADAQRGALEVYVGPNGEQGMTFSFSNSHISLVIPFESSSRTQTLKPRTLRIPPLDPSFWRTGMSASGFVYTGWKDLNRNKRADYPKEIMGRDKSVYFDDERILLTMIVNGANSQIASILLLDPNNKEVFSESKKMSSWIWSTGNHGREFNLSHGSEGLGKRIWDKHGEGDYRAIFMIDNTVVDDLRFKLAKTVSNYVSNYYEDLDEDGSADVSTELIGRGKRKFNQNESFTLSLLVLKNAKGQSARLKLLSPDGSTVFTKTTTFVTSSGVWSLKSNVRDVISKHGSGTYRSSFYLDGEYVGGKTFTLEGRGGE